MILTYTMLSIPSLANIFQSLRRYKHYTNTLVVSLGREDSHNVVTEERSRFRGYGTSPERVRSNRDGRIHDRLYFYDEDRDRGSKEVDEREHLRENEQ